MITKNVTLEEIYSNLLPSLYDDPDLADAMLNESQDNNIERFINLLSYDRKQFGGKDLVVLELACGVGSMMDACQKLEYTYYGVDNSEYIIKKAKKIHGKSGTFIHGNIAKSDWVPPTSFDLVGISPCTMTYLTWEDSVEHLKVISKCMNDGGRYYMFLGSYFLQNEIDYELRVTHVKKKIRGKVVNYQVGEFQEYLDCATGARSLIFWMKKGNRVVANRSILQTRIPKEFQVYKDYYGFSKVSFLSIDYDDASNCIETPIGEVPDIALFIK